ncbi:DHA1 family purine base/nucleoside efflux pump-like MFS transporter [Paenibacillus rhizosphaerae]|uniref:DHA1 family purine base/nucleoside efflux pump-like MFS transporter n=1 Tax=Paenibacillus rhizosphaerae TaxID=297318 RepID=A0A839TL23_9BACL|nr:MFS transporter [Paenibacillus rhizosphaerae]MBB3126430.1 DHA1 family purine base/nucleoside efflux pump-like MFS transporter [Paenibacillus rhizosphaerae]
MNFKIYILAIACFVTGMVELIVGGMLDLVSSDLHISVSTAGQLITLYSVIFAVSGPVLLAAASRVERKMLYQCALLVFIAGNVLSVVSPNFTMMVIARILSAASAALITVLSITMASQMAEPAYRARAIGVIFMGVSGSLVLGVPVGMMLGNAFGWRAPFVMISILAVISFIAVQIFITKTPPSETVPLRRQLASLKNGKIIFGQLITIWMLTGHLTLYAYLTPFLQETLHLSPSMLSLFYFIFGIAAVLGGGAGGWVTDRFGPEKSILTIVSVFAVAMLLMPVSTVSVYVCLIVMIIWSMLSWSISPSMQSYLIKAAPETPDIQQSLNSSASHIGIALGSAIGGMVIEGSSVYYNAWVGVIFVLLALGSAVLSITWTKRRSQSPSAAGVQETS